MRLRAFTLIELLLVIVIISLTTSIVLSVSNTKKKYSIIDLKQLTYPSGTFYVFSDNTNILIKNNKQKSINIQITPYEVLIYENNAFYKKRFSDLEGKKVIFKYSQKNGIGDSFILVSKEGVFVFKPFIIKKFNSISNAKDFFLLNEYQPLQGNYY